MPNHTHHELVEIYQEENAKLRAELKEAHKYLYDAGIAAGEQMKRMQEEIDRYKIEGALVVHALDRATQLIYALIAWLPEGQTLSPDLATCKYAFDEALGAVLWKGTIP